MNSSSLKIARVYIQLKTRSLKRPFDYLVPEELRKKAGEGSIVMVPFGRRKALGVIGELSHSTDLKIERLEAIEKLLDYPPIPGPLIRLALWVAEYYYCSVASALGLVLPPGGLPSLKSENLQGKRVYTLQAPPVKPLSAQFAKLAANAYVVIRDSSIRLTQARQRVMDVMSDNKEMPVAELAKLAVTGRPTISSLARLGVLQIETKEIARDNLRYYATGKGQQAEVEQEAEINAKRLVLNQAQQTALAAIVARLKELKADPMPRKVSVAPILIQGITGSGKTEIYLQAIEAVLKRGGGAIVLVPEISLTHQTVRRFRRRFGDLAGVLHSGLGIGERYDEFMRIRSGRTRVVIGPRSALFAPVAALRLIVIDEENDPSFKQENEPRYDARLAALKRAELEGAAVVYGSATPSIENYYLVKDRYVLPERATGAALPLVEIVDMTKEDNELFSRSLIEEIDNTIKKGGKSILMLNSRGYARFLQCASCGYVWKCRNCDISLTMHERNSRLLCHHCGFTLIKPDICPECNSSGVRRWGAGTEKIEQEVKRLFPEAAVFRLDADTASGYGKGPRIMEAFDKSEKAILVGTQMVAKGHHFPQVILAAVINADLALQFPEFRAEERTFSLLLQLAGRSGRSHLPGKVIIQSWNADIECIKMAADHNLSDFYELELSRRRQLGYPPFKGLINILCLSKEDGKPWEAARFLKEKIAPLTNNASLLGPAVLFKLKGWSRSHFLVKTDEVGGTLQDIKPVIEHYREPYRSRGVRILIDVDPQWLS